LPSRGCVLFGIGFCCKFGDHLSVDLHAAGGDQFFDLRREAIPAAAIIFCNRSDGMALRFWRRRTFQFLLRIRTRAIRQFRRQFLRRKTRRFVAKMEPPPRACRARQQVALERLRQQLPRILSMLGSSWTSLSPKRKQKFLAGLVKNRTDDHGFFCPPS